MKSILALLSFLALSAVASAQTVTIVFYIGILSNGAGTPVADNSLVQLIASPDSTFAAPTTTAFTGGNDVLFYTGGVDSSTVANTAGGTQISITGLDLAIYPIAGYKVALRWYPTLTVASSTPGAGTAYGQFDYNSDPSWVVPAANGSDTLYMLTTTAGGSLPDTTGRATQTTPAAIPEPSTYAALAGLAALGAAIWRKRRAAKMNATVL